MNKEQIKKYWGWFTNVLLALIIVIMFVPSWRIKFSATIKSIFMGTTELKIENKQPLNFSQEQWVIYDKNEQMHNFNDFKGQPIVLNFWATWCPGCRAELPQLKKLREQFKDEIHFISVSNESYDVIKQSGEFDKNDFIYFTQYLPIQLNFSVYPTTFIIDSDFNVVMTIEGTTKLNTKENIEFLKNL